MGLETIDPRAERVLNKSLRRSHFETACRILIEAKIHSRVFVLLQPPGTPVHESVDWATRSCLYAFEQGMERCAVIPTREGNGWLDELRHTGQWESPKLGQLEQLLLRLLSTLAEGEKVVSGETQGSTRVATIDLWDWDQLQGGCDKCRYLRYDTLRQMNVQQQPIQRARCALCEQT
jgi:uncharacterized Fe-S cluster-containing MiaB family protein